MGIKKQEDQVYKLKQQENRMSATLAQRMEEFTKLENVKREKMRVEMEAERYALEKVLKLEERKQLEELDRKLMTKEMAFNERLLQKEEMKKRERETADKINNANEVKNEARLFSETLAEDEDVD